MAGHYCEPLVVADVARVVALSEDRLAHIFKETTGFPVADYLMRLRIAIARRFLAETDAKLDVIAHCVGFGDGSASRARLLIWRVYGRVSSVGRCDRGGQG